MPRSKSSKRLLIAVAVPLILAGASVLVIQRRSVAVPFQLASVHPNGVPVEKFLNSNLDIRYVGTKSCGECHRAIANRFSSTPHIRSTLSADRSAFEPLLRGRRRVTVSGIEQSFYYLLFEEKGRLNLTGQNALREPIGGKVPVKYLIGSGRQGTSLLGHRPGSQELVQLPVSYFANTKRWDISPDFDPALRMFGNLFLRPVTEDCLVCHATYFEIERTGQFGSQVLGVSCEKCHGPGELHVNEWRRVPGRKLGKDEFDPTIINPKHLSAERQMEICAECHTQALTPKKSSHYQFRPGQSLRAFYQAVSSTIGSQHTEYESLKESLCYKRARNKAMLTCTTCHPVHEFRTNLMTHYNSRCKTCHGQSEKNCSLLAPNANVSQNCIRCHMQQRKAHFDHGSFKNHLIAIYAGPPPQTGNSARPH